MTHSSYMQPRRFTPLGNQMNSAYTHCKGCGCLIVAVVETSGAQRTHCAVCTEKQGQAPAMALDLAPHRRPPYESPAPIPQE